MSFHQILDYFAEQAVKEIPEHCERFDAAIKLRKDYRMLKQKSAAKTLESSARAVYGVTRLAGTLAALYNVFSKWEKFQLDIPKTILDCGSGPGTAMFAANQFFGGAIDYTAVEKDAGFIDMAKRAVFHLLPKECHRFSWVCGTLPEKRVTSPHDLTIISYMLSETPAEDVETVLAWAIVNSKKYLVITDAGTPHVYRQLMTARDFLISRGLTILAPCLHQQKCPMVGADFCHFTARFTRHQEAKRLKAATAPSEDEKFCYLIAAMPNAVPSLRDSEGMIVKRPLRRQGHIIFDLCTNRGTMSRTITSKKQGLSYKRAKSLDWGDVLFP